MKFIIIVNNEINNEINNEEDNKIELIQTDMLSKSGFEKAENLKTTLKIKPDLVFSSPYISTLQTIYPLCFRDKIEANIDNALYPCKHMNINYSIRNYLENYTYLYDIINLNYKGSCLNNNIPQIETDVEIKNRLFPFLYDIYNKLKKTDKTVLIATHSCIKKLILEYFNKDNTIKKYDTVKKNEIYADILEMVGYDDFEDHDNEVVTYSM